MSEVDCTIRFDSPTNSYYAGQTVYGTLDFQVNEVTPVKRLVLQIQGIAEGTWYGERDNEFKEDESLLLLNVYLIPNQIDLPCGRHKYNFDFLLPFMLPSSQSKERVGEFCYEISYKAKVIFVLPMKFDLVFNKEFFVVSGFDLNLNQNLTVPYSAEHAEMIVNVARSGWVAGEEIAFNVTLKNPNDDRIQSIASVLYKDVSLIFTPKCCNSCVSASSRTANLRISENTVICSPGKSSYENRLTIPLTCKTPSTVDDDMKIINIQYRLVVQITKKSLKSVPMNLPITIASIPITRSSNPTSPSNLILTSSLNLL